VAQWLGCNTFALFIAPNSTQLDSIQLNKQLAVVTISISLSTEIWSK